MLCSTGNTTLDVLLCMLLPLLLARLTSGLQTAWEQLQGWLSSGISTMTDFVRIIQHEEVSGDVLWWAVPAATALLCRLRQFRTASSTAC